MKNQITLSLITAAVLGLTGCGGDSAPTTTPSEASSLIQANSSVALENKASLEVAVEVALEKNTNKLKANGLVEEVAQQESKKFTSTALGNLNLDELEAAVLTECNEDEKCKEEAYASFTGALTDDKEEAYSRYTDDKEEAYSSSRYTGSLIMDKEEAYAIAQDIRDNGKEEAYAINDGLVEKFTCETGELRTVQHYGIEDIFDTSNGVENTYPNATTAILPNLVAYNNNVNAEFSPYDHVQNNRLFLEDIKNLPMGITKGRFYIGLKSNGSSLQANDTMSIGDLNTQARFSKDLTDLQTNGWNNQLVSNNNLATDIYWNNFTNITFLDGQTTLLDHVQTNTRFDAYVQDDTSVDFITVATCSKPDPIKEVEQIVNKFECNEKQGDILKISGGVIDNFTAGTDTSTPSSKLETIALGNTVYPTVAPYDFDKYDYHFVDTLNLGLSSSQVVTKAQFNIGYKKLGSPLVSNDAIYIGDINGSNGNHAGGHLYDTLFPIIPQGWVVSGVPLYGQVATVNLNELNNTSGQATGTVGTTMSNKGFLDVYVQDDTAVDFTQLNLCVTDNCDEGAENISLDLSTLASWTFKPSDAVENNPLPNVWDNSLTWFKFDSQSNGTRVLEIPFCACGDTIANINNLKADNAATVKLDGTLVATQQASGQASMLADNNGGTHSDGSMTIPAGTSGGTNHVLRVDVTNQTLNFGVAIDGTLNFRGNLGKCQ